MNQFIELLKSGENINEKKRVVYVDVKKIRVYRTRFEDNTYPRP